MRRIRWNSLCLATGITALTFVGIGTASAADTALTGQVSSVEEGAMEGVLVSAQKNGSTIRTTVVTDAQGRTTQVRISGLQRASGLDPALFVLKNPHPAKPDPGRL